MTALLIRDGTEADWPYVLKSMIETFKRSPYASGVPTPVVAGLVEAIVKHPEWHTHIACVQDEPSEVIGFVVWRRATPVPQLAWVHVKRQWRRHGVARGLIGHLGLLDQPPGQYVTCAFMVGRVDGQNSPPLIDLAAGAGLQLRYRPYLPVVARYELVEKLH